MFHKHNTTQKEGAISVQCHHYLGFSVSFLLFSGGDSVEHK